MLNNLCSLLGQSLQTGCEQSLDNPYAKIALAVLAIGSPLTGLVYAYNRKEADFELEYIPTFRDYLPEKRVLPLQSLVKAYFANGRDFALHTQYQLGIGKKSGPSSPSEPALSFDETVQEILKRLGLPLDGTYPPELENTDKNAEQIIEWCLNKQKSSVSPRT